MKNSNYNMMLGFCKEEKTFLMSEEGKQEDQTEYKQERKAKQEQKYFLTLVPI